MITSRAFARLACALCRWGCGLLLLLSLAACGTALPTPALPAGAPAAAEATAVASSSPARADTPPPAQRAPTLPPIATPTERLPTTALPALSPLPTGLPPTASPQRLPPTSPVAPTSGATSATSATWQTYRNEQAGYSVAYPPGWRATERAGTPPKFATSFAPAGGGAGILVAVRPLAPEEREPIDLPNGRCTPVSVGGLSGTSCFDTIASTIVTRLVGKDQKQFTISTSGRRLDPAIYQHFIDSFQALP